MPAPRLEGVDALEEDLAATEASWALYKEYSSELKVWTCILVFLVVAVVFGVE